MARSLSHLRADTLLAAREQRGETENDSEGRHRADNEPHEPMYFQLALPALQAARLAAAPGARL